MGYLTTLTIYNDGIDLIKENSQEFANKIILAAKTFNDSSSEIQVGNFANLVRVQKSRHADDPTAYVHMGNCVFEMNPYSQETKNLLERNPAFFEKAVKFMEAEIKQLKVMLKDAKHELRNS